jgi:hypothetical protein
LDALSFGGKSGVDVWLRGESRLRERRNRQDWKGSRCRHARVTIPFMQKRAIGMRTTRELKEVQAGLFPKEESMIKDLIFRVGILAFVPLRASISLEKPLFPLVVYITTGLLSV